jgi:GTP cyclohydrolase I
MDKIKPVRSINQLYHIFKVKNQELLNLKEENDEWSIENEHFYLKLKEIDQSIQKNIFFFLTIKGMKPKSDKAKETQKQLLEAYNLILQGNNILQHVLTQNFKERYSKGQRLGSLMKIPE